MQGIELETYWSNRYVNQQTGWDIGAPSTPLKMYIDQIRDKDINILIPGAGNAYEAEYLFEQGFKNVMVLDISEIPLQALKKRIPNFPGENLMQGDFFKHTATYDLILEQTFFCSFEPTTYNRHAYGKKMGELLKAGGKLVGVWFNHPLVEDAKRPFGGTREEYLGYLTPHLKARIFDTCRNSIPTRQGKEIFGIFTKE